MSVKYVNKYTFEQRLADTKAVRIKYPTKIPVICEKYNSNDPDIDKNKYLIDECCNVGQLLTIIRKRLQLSQEQALFIFIGNSIPSSNTLISSLYFTHKNGDGFLYITYTRENTFG